MATQKQIQAIEDIEEYAAIKFTGDLNNPQDVSKFLKNNLWRIHTNLWGLIHGY